MKLNAEFLKKLVATFLVEAREHVQELGSGLLMLEKVAGREAQQPLVETLFREMHSLKGAARAVDAGEIERLCQALEDVLGDVKAGNRPVSPDLLDTLHLATAVLDQLVEALETGRPQAVSAVATVLQNLATCRGTKPGAAPREAAPPEVQPPAAKPAVPAAAAQDHGEGAHGHGGAGETVRIATSKLDTIFVQAEELLGVKLARAGRAAELRTLSALMAERQRLWTEMAPLVRSMRNTIGKTMESPAHGTGGAGVPMELQWNLLALIDREREHADAARDRVADLARAMADDRRRFDAMSDRLLEDVMKALMLPFATIVAGFPKMMHDLARDSNKEAMFGMHGADIEVDKRILEKIKSPLMHLLRNVIDHGVEPPAERAQRGKPRCGTINLAINQSGGNVEIVIVDDGRGIDAAAVKAAAVKAGVVGPDEAAQLSDNDARNLVFRSGVSTSREVTSVSGRGLGMAIVHDAITKLGGTVTIDSLADKGTTVRIMLPSTLVTLRGTLVQVSAREFVVPSANVARVVRIARTSVRCVENRGIVCLDGIILPLVRLADVLGIAAGQAEEEAAAPLMVLVLHHGHTAIAFAVDRVIGEQEVLAKSLGRLLPRVHNVAGATVLGTNKVVPILNAADLLQTAVNCSPVKMQAAVAEKAVRANKLLVVDDSITTRTMVQLVLESAGYAVTTAPDGAAAFNMLQAEPFDLVVSDVEMPRMDGFELTRRVRAESGLASLPVVLVTARDAKEDRERGIDAGANAYIVKGNFDQGNLLETIGRLI